MSKIRKIHIKEIFTKKPFYEIAAPFAEKKGTVLLLSGGEQDNARYNILAAEPWLEISSKGTRISITEQGKITELSGNPFNKLQEIISELSESFRKCLIDNKQLLKLPVSAGLFGYLSYDLKDHIEDISRTTIDDLMLPDLYMISPGLVVIEDRNSGKILAIVVEPVSSDEAETERIFNLVTKAENTTFILNNFAVSPEGFKSNFFRDEYENSISDIINYIEEGDIYQVNMSQRFSIDFSGDTYSLFVELFKENPAPFFAYINCGDHQIVSTSPERFILQNESRIEARPIKGTRPRGVSYEEDEKLKKELKNSPKDDAELSMIVDLLRNDIGKVSKGGSVKVLEHKSMTEYKNVFHLVSTIEGYLEDDKNSIDLLKAAFPGGSITGCPKIRAMEIIDEKEPFRRHLYTGSIGYIGFNSKMDLSIVIRTATITRDKLFFSVGGGIVYDSNPADEYDETLHKARSLMKVLNRHKLNVFHTNNDTKNFDRQKNICWFNGKFISEDNAAVSVLGKGYQYGKGIFETLKVVEGKIEYLEDHIKRLKEGSKAIIGIEPDEYDWQGIINLLLIRNKLNNSTSSVKIMVSEGRNGLFSNMNITIISRKYTKRDAIKKNKSINLGVYPHKRENFLSDYKTMNYLFYLKAGEWAKENGFDEAIILNADGSVSETNTGNILIIKNKSVIVPESNHRLPGIMEGKVIEDYEKKGYRILRKTIVPRDLSNTETILITNSLIGVISGSLLQHN